MIDVKNIPQINSLMQRYTNYRQALDVIDGGGAIAAFTLSGPTGVSEVISEGITYPPTMLQSIRDQVQARIDDLTQQLAALGVTLS